MVLERYSDAVIERITNPLSGIQRKQFKHFGPPTIADVVDACEEEASRIARSRYYSGFRPERRELRAPAVSLANVLVVLNHPRYESMVERSKTAKPREFRFDDRGIWVALGWLDDQDGWSARGPRPFNKGDLDALYRRHEGQAAIE